VRYGFSLGQFVIGVDRAESARRVIFNMEITGYAKTIKIIDAFSVLHHVISQNIKRRAALNWRQPLISTKETSRHLQYLVSRHLHPPADSSSSESLGLQILF